MPAKMGGGRERAIRTMMKLAGSAQRWMYRVSGGRFGGRAAGGMPVLLLTTTGRKTGQPRTWPIAYLREGEDLLIVASAGGVTKHPAWYHNLRANPEVTVEIGRRSQRCRADIVSGAERDRLWKRFTDAGSNFSKYQEGIDRTIPVVVLRPVSGG